MGGEESDQWGLHIETKCIIVKVDCMQFRESKKRGEEGRKRSRNFAEETAREYIRQVGNLNQNESVSAGYNIKRLLAVAEGTHL